MLAVLEDLIVPFDGVLARVWLARAGDICPDCRLRRECPDQTRCLHLATSVGLTRRLDGPFRRIPIGVGQVGQVVTRRTPLLVLEDLHGAGLADAGWLALHRVRSFAAVPLERGAECLGVLALFSRRELGADDVRSLSASARLLAHTLEPARAESARTLAEIEREAIERTLLATGGRVSGPRGAACILGLKPTTLHSRMKKLGVRRDLR